MFKRMKQRIGLWALIGLAVACCWVLYTFVAEPNYNVGRWTIVAITAPAALLGRTMALTYYWFILLNAATYTLFGVATELLLHNRRYRFSH
jgi:hypothetical protein